MAENKWVTGVVNGCNLWISGPVTPLISPAWANMWKVLPSLAARSKSGYTMARDEHLWALNEKPRQNSTVGEHRVNGSLFKGVEHAHGGDLGERWNAEEIGGGVLHQGIIYFCSFIPCFFYLSTMGFITIFHYYLGECFFKAPNKQILNSTRFSGGHHTWYCKCCW